MTLTIKDYGKTQEEANQVADKKMTTQEVQELYTIESFMAPYAIVTRKSDGVRGTLEFTHMPRFYFNFVEDK